MMMDDILAVVWTTINIVRHLHLQPQRHQPQQQQLQQPAQIRQRQQAATGQQKSRLVGKAAAISNISIVAVRSYT